MLKLYILVTFVQSEDFIELVLTLHDSFIMKNFLNLDILLKFILNEFKHAQSIL